MDTSIDQDKLRRIGQGFCATVWAPETGGGYAIKREDGGPGRSVLRDYEMHRRVLESRPTLVHVPQCHRYIPHYDATWWKSYIQGFPHQFQKRCNALITDRIEPFPQSVRNNLIDKYCPPSLKQTVSTSDPDRDCLVRPYLGRQRRLIEHSRFQAFSLRNFPLHIDQIEDLGLDADQYARIMAQTLAELHWKAHVDANDIEFVLAPPPEKSAACKPPASPSSAVTIDSPHLGEHALWILDFDCCKDMPMDEAGVQQAVKAFFRNDPYYPRPRDGTDQSLWNVFRDHFLRASAEILGVKSPHSPLPGLWVEMVEEFDQGRRI